MNEAGYQPIPVSEMTSYCLGVGIFDPEEIERVIRFTISLDEVFLEHARKKREQAIEAAKRKT